MNLETVELVRWAQHKLFLDQASLHIICLGSVVCLLFGLLTLAKSLAEVLSRWTLEKLVDSGFAGGFEDMTHHESLTTNKMMQIKLLC